MLIYYENRSHNHKEHTVQTSTEAKMYNDELIAILAETKRRIAFCLTVAVNAGVHVDILVEPGTSGIAWDYWDKLGFTEGNPGREFTHVLQHGHPDDPNHVQIHRIRL